MPGFALQLDKTPFCRWMQSHGAIPILQTIHIYAISMLFTGFIMITVRVFMVGNKSRTLAQTMNRFMPWIWWCLLVLTITGWLLAIAEPPRDLLNPAFWTKMVFVPVTALLVLSVPDLHTPPHRRLGHAARRPGRRQGGFDRLPCPLAHDHVSGPVDRLRPDLR